VSSGSQAATVDEIKSATSSWIARDEEHGDSRRKVIDLREELGIFHRFLPKRDERLLDRVRRRAARMLGVSRERSFLPPTSTREAPRRLVVEELFLPAVDRSRELRRRVQRR
jgi:hypothetical protein